jgi:hypothetical protein
MIEKYFLAVMIVVGILFADFRLAYQQGHRIGLQDGIHHELEWENGLKKQVEQFSDKVLGQEKTIDSLSSVLAQQIELRLKAEKKLKMAIQYDPSNKFQGFWLPDGVNHHATGINDPELDRQALKSIQIIQGDGNTYAILPVYTDPTKPVPAFSCPPGITTDCRN